MLIRRRCGLAWRYRVLCLQVPGTQPVLLTPGTCSLRFTGLGSDCIRHKFEHTPLAANRRARGRKTIFAGIIRSFPSEKSDSPSRKSLHCIGRVL